jgi:IS605 OrfB family transposase
VLATLSTGEKVVGLKPHKAQIKRWRRLSRSLSRKGKGSANSRKARARLARLHARIAHIRADALHKLTSDLTRRFHPIATEDLNVRGMLKNPHLARSIADMSFFEFRRQLEYQDGTAWWLGGYSGPLVSVQRDVFGLWDGSGKNAAGYPPVDLSGLWNPPRPGRTCGQEPPGVWLGRPKRIYGEFRRMSSLWRGRRWSSSQDDGETGLSEAGSKRRI